MKQRLVYSLCVLVICMMWATSAVYAGAPYYEGKTISIIPGTKAGDVYDLYARLLAQHLPKYIPGRPNIIVQNMPGAASLIAANHVYRVAKPDGLTIGAIYSALYFDQLVGRPEVQYDYSKFEWLGSPVTSNHLLYMRADTPYKTIDDVIKHPQPPKCGATGTSSTAYWVPKLLDEVINTKFEVVLGYQAGQDIDLAVERGEVVCRAFTLTAFFAREPFHTWRKKNFVRVLMQTGTRRDKRLPDTPTIYELMDQYKSSNADRSVAKLTLASSVFGRPYVLAPGTPKELVKILQEAFEKTVKDEAFNADAIRQKLEVDPSSADELEKLAHEVMSQPPDVVKRMRALLGQ